MVIARQLYHLIEPMWQGAKGKATGVSIYEYKSHTFVLIHEYVQAQHFLKAPAKASGNLNWVLQSGMAESGAIFS